VALNDWWAERAEEKYWMAAPAKGTLGPALSAPRHDEERRFEWTHELVSLAQPGDTVFVWDRSARRPGITGWARVLGPLTEEERPRIVRGRAGETVAHWVMPVSDTLPLAQPIDLTALRKVGSDIVAARSALSESVEGPLYFPFIGRATTLGPAPGYVTKFPRDLFALLNARYGFEFAL
jgi:hypothetical protein